MPYLDADRKFELETGASMEVPGDLNYKITSVINEYLQERELRYTVINDVLGALEGAKFEFYRRIAAAYEDKKIKENGDVYTR